MSFFYFGDDQAVDEVLPADASVLIVGGEIDYAASPQLRKRLTDLIKAGRRPVLDLSTATFIDSTAIGVLVGASSQLREHGEDSLAVVCTHEMVLQIFEISGLDGLVTIYPTREEALSALALAS
jgi:anti-sigma B factor antagonist